MDASQALAAVVEVARDTLLSEAGDPGRAPMDRYDESACQLIKIAGRWFVLELRTLTREETCLAPGSEPHSCGGDFWSGGSDAPDRLYVPHGDECEAVDFAARLQKAPTVAYEAECRRCAQFFNPHSTSPDDLVHFGYEDDDGQHECGGMGSLVGAWS